MLGASHDSPHDALGADDRIGTVDDLIGPVRAGDYLYVVGDTSMAGAGLYPGDYAALRPSMEAGRGRYLRRLDLDGEGGLLRRLYDDGNHLRLISANPLFRERRYPAGTVRIQGLLVARIVIRQLRG